MRSKKALLFEKEAKTLAHWFACWGSPSALITKVFWFFFSKKNCLPYGPRRMAKPHAA
jgi:hypothetical protein